MRISDWSSDVCSSDLPELFVLHPEGTPLYIANEDDNMVTVVDVEKGTVLAEVPVGVEPEGMGISPDGRVLVNTSETTNMAHFIDTATPQIPDHVLVGNRPRFAALTAAGHDRTAALVGKRGSGRREIGGPRT